jgi:Peptidase family S41
MKLSLLCALLVSLTFGCASVENAAVINPKPTPFVAPTQAADWQAAATKDIEAAYKRTFENHPGMIDPLNPGFAKQLDAARAKGLEFAGKATNAASYEASILAFNAAINDGHAGASPRVPENLKPPTLWPGFVPAWRGEALVVFRSQVAGAAAGDKIISCDGVEINALIERNVFAFAGRSNEAGRWWTQARNVLIDNGNPYVQRPQSCVLRNTAGEKSMPLNWLEVDESYKAWRAASYNGDRMPISLSLPRPKMFWIGMPTFQPDENERAAYKALIESLETRRAELKTARAVVLDLRHNQGGSSTWSRDIARALWGKTQLDAAMNRRNAKVEIWWRPTEGHSAYFKSLILEMRAQGRADTQRYFEKLTAGLDGARKEGKTFYVEPKSAVTADAEAIAQSDFTTPVFVIMPGQCASACLDAVDYFSQFANTTLIGAPTQADSTYMEIRTELLPSQMARVILPAKIWVNRPRGNGEIYRPKIVVDELAWSTENFIKRIETALFEAVKKK